MQPWARASAPTFLRDFDLPLREQRTRERSAQQIFVFVDGSGAQRGPDVAGDEFLAQVFDVGGAGAGGESFLVRGFQIFLLAEIADHGDHFAAVIILLQPRNNDGGIETSGIGKNNFLRQCRSP